MINTNKSKFKAEWEKTCKSLKNIDAKNRLTKSTVERKKAHLDNEFIVGMGGHRIH